MKDPLANFISSALKLNEKAFLFGFYEFVILSSCMSFTSNHANIGHALCFYCFTCFHVNCVFTAYATQLKLK